MKKAIGAIILCCALLLSTFAFMACGGKATEVALVDWEDGSIETELYADVTVDNAAAYDAAGNAYAVAAKVKRTDGTEVVTIGGSFRADYAGGYTIEYTLADPNLHARTKTVTVTIKGGDTPVPYFGAMPQVYEGAAFAVPAHGYALDPAVAVTEESLTLYRVDGDDRIKVDADLSAAVALDAGRYVFVYKVTAGEKEAAAELPFRVRIESEKYALAALNGPDENVLAVSCWDNGIGGWKMEQTAFTHETYRNEFVSSGSAKIALPASNGAAHVYVVPEISQSDFVERMSVSGAVVSVWLYLDADNGEPRTATSGKRNVTLSNHAWTNLRVSAEDFGFKDDAKGFWTALSMGKSALFSVTNAGWDAYTVYVDSIYVAVPLVGSVAPVTAAYGSEITVTATSAQTDKFYYELYDTVDGSNPQTSADGKFTPRVAGDIKANAYPCDNAYYAETMTADVHVTHTGSLKFGQNDYRLPAGTSDRPTATVTGGTATVDYRIQTTDGAQLFSYLKEGDKIRMFEGAHQLNAHAKIDGVDYVTSTEITAAKAAVTAGTIENFDDPSSAQNTRYPLTAYMGDYMGAEGVVRYDLTGDMWPGFALSYALQTKEKLLEQGFTADDWLAYRFYMEDVPDNYFIVDFVFGKGQYELRYINEGWNTAYISAGRFLESFDQWFAPQHSGYVFFTNNNYTGSLYVYFDWIGLVKNGQAADVTTGAGEVEFDNFDHEHATISVAAKSTDVIVDWVSEYQGRNGVMKLYTQAPYNAQPTIKGLRSRLTKDAFIEKGVDATYDMFCVDVYCASEGEYTMLDAGGNTIATFDEGKKWYTVEIPAAAVLDKIDADSKAVDISFGFTDRNKQHPHEIYIDKMYFKKGAGVAVEGNKLVCSQGTDNTYTFTVNGKSDASYTIGADGYDLMQLVEAGSFSKDYTIVVTGKKDGAPVGDPITLTWSSPAGSNEINAFDSSLSRPRFIGNPGLTQTFVTSQSDGTTTKHGVVKIQLNAYEWPNLKFGTPMCSKEEAAAFNGDDDSVVLVAYFTANSLQDLKIVYKHNGADVVQLDVKAGWSEYKIPAQYFDYDAVASGADFIYIVRNNASLADVVMYIDEIRFDRPAGVPDNGVKIEENKLVLTASANESLTYKFTVNGTSDNAYVIDKTNGYDLTQLPKADAFSEDYAIVVTGYNGENQAVGETVNLTWTSPAGTNEINGFGSAAARKKFFGNSTLTQTFVSSVPDGTTTKYGVAKIELTGEYPDLKIGAPLCTEEQAAAYSGENAYLVFVLYFASDTKNMSGLTFTYRSKNGDGSNKDLQFQYRVGWNEYWIPVSYFDYDEIAKGASSSHFFFPALSDLSGITMYIDEIRLDTKTAAVATDTKAVFVDFSYAGAVHGFGTAGGGVYCGYLPSAQVNAVEGGTISTLGACIRYCATEEWSEVKGFTPAMTEAQYTAFAASGAKFVIEGYSNTDAGGNKMYHNLGGTDVELGALPKGGVFKFEIDASIVLDNFDAFVNGTAKIMFNNGGYSIAQDIYFTGMYFEKAAA